MREFNLHYQKYQETEIIKYFYTAIIVNGIETLKQTYNHTTCHKQKFSGKKT